MGPWEREVRQRDLAVPLPELMIGTSSAWTCSQGRTRYPLTEPQSLPIWKATPTSERRKGLLSNFNLNDGENSEPLRYEQTRPLERPPLREGKIAGITAEFVALIVGALLLVPLPRIWSGGMGARCWATELAGPSVRFWSCLSMAFGESRTSSTRIFSGAYTMSDRADYLDRGFTPTCWISANGVSEQSAWGQNSLCIPLHDHIVKYPFVPDVDVPVKSLKFYRFSYPQRSPRRCTHRAQPCINGVSSCECLYHSYQVYFKDWSIRRISRDRCKCTFCEYFPIMRE